MKLHAGLLGVLIGSIAFHGVSFSKDPVQEELLKFLKNCDCVYQEVNKTADLQIAKAMCHCPGHTLDGLTIACSLGKDAKIKTFEECAKDEKVSIQTNIKEQKSNYENESLKKDLPNAVIPK